MTTYKLTIQVIGDKDARGYPELRTIYEQSIDELNVKAIIAVANNLILLVDQSIEYYERDRK